MKELLSIFAGVVAVIAVYLTMADTPAPQAADHAESAAISANADVQGSCVTADDADLDKPSAYLLFTRARAYRSCGRTDDADRLLAQAKRVTKQQ